MEIFAFILLGIIVCAIVAYILAVVLIYDLAKANGVGHLAGELAFIAVFATPVIAGICLIAASMKTFKNKQENSANPNSYFINEEMQNNNDFHTET